MAIFDTGKKLQSLEKEKDRIWEKIKELEKLLKKKTSDYEKDARSASKMTSEFRNRSKEAKLETIDNLNESARLLNKIKDFHSTIEAVKDQIHESLESASGNEKQICENLEKAKKNTNDIQENINTVNEILVKYPDISERLTAFNNIFNEAQELYNKMSAPYNTILKRKEDINEIYYEIVGYDTDPDNDGDDTYVEGLKDQLKESYNNIKKELSELQIGLVEYKSETINGYDNLKKERLNDFSNLKSEWDDKFLETFNKIEDLLPRALTTGLSAAYSSKKKDEIEESKSYYSKFLWAVVGLVIVSLIPFGVSIEFLRSGTDLKQILIDIPRLVIAILPLYIPILWVAYSANKKVNLSKRLIEEYTHKEVLSKTFEGLSKQIEKIDNKDMSSDLRNKLLFNILDISSENPGKLISDYQKSDHPFMDALDKSLQLGNAIEKLSNIPGFSKITSILEKKSKAILEKHAEKIEVGLSHIEGETPLEEEESLEKKVD